MIARNTILGRTLLIGALVGMSLASGCGPLIKREKDVFSVPERHPITVDSDAASLTIPVPRGVTALSAQSERDVAAFLAVYKARGHGPLTIARPVGSANERTARRVADDVAKIALRSGVDVISVSPQSYNVSATEDSAPVLVSFTRFVASATPCGDWSKDAAKSASNTPLPDFGCATQNNFAAMVEDPHDMLAPRAMGPADAERRAVVFEKYRKGQSSVTSRSSSENANVSKVEGGGQ